MWQRLADMKCALGVVVLKMQESRVSKVVVEHERRADGREKAGARDYV